MVATIYEERRKVGLGRQICFCVLATNLDDFVVIYEADMLKNLQFSHELEQLYSQDIFFVDPQKVNVGSPVAARYLGGGDFYWYRAQIKSMNRERNEYDVFFVDYGHSQVNTLEQLRALPAKFAQYPPMAIQCKLFGLNEYDWNNNDIRQKFCELILHDWNKGKCLVSFLTETAPHYVRVWNVDSGQELVPSILGAKPCSAKNADLMVLSDSSRSPASGLGRNDQFEFVNDMVNSLKQCAPSPAANADNQVSHTPAQRLASCQRDAAVQAASHSDETKAVLMDCCQEDLSCVLTQFCPALCQFLSSAVDQ